jgi:hypothetical protein
MKVTFLGTSSQDGSCPSVYATDRGTLIVQGARVLDAETLSIMDIPGHETVVEIPHELLPYFPAADA